MTLFALAPRRPLFASSPLGQKTQLLRRPFFTPARSLDPNKGQNRPGNGGEDADDDDRKTSTSSSASDPRTWTTAQAADAAYGWSEEASKQLLSSTPPNARIIDLPLTAIRRPLAGSRADDELKVEALAASIMLHGLREPIDVLECPPGSQRYFGFSGCHRFAAMKKLGKEKVRCRVRGVSEATLRMHLA
jgi:sulfiredoxin